MGHSLEAWLQLIVVEGQSTDRERGHRSAQQKAQETGGNNSEHSKCLTHPEKPQALGESGSRYSLRGLCLKKVFTLKSVREISLFTPV